jgi:hypothetical protein
MFKAAANRWFDEHQVPAGGDTPTLRSTGWIDFIASADFAACRNYIVWARRDPEEDCVWPDRFATDSPTAG